MLKRIQKALEPPRLGQFDWADSLVTWGFVAFCVFVILRATSACAAGEAVIRYCDGATRTFQGVQDIFEQGGFTKIRSVDGRLLAKVTVGDSVTFVPAEPEVVEQE